MSIGTAVTMDRAFPRIVIHGMGTDAETDRDKAKMKSRHKDMRLKTMAQKNVSNKA